MWSAVLKATPPGGPEPTLRPLRVGLLGCGAVGSEVVRRLSAPPRGGISAHLNHIAVADPSKPRGPWVDHDLIHSHPDHVVTDPDIDVVIELIGGIEPARSLILTALLRGKDVVTANKQVIAQHGTELFDAARVTGSLLHFEASVGGAVPVVRTISQALAGDTITSVSGIFNGTSNYIIDRLASGVPFEAALKEARALGYAEADPSADIGGHDAAAKLAIVARLAFGAEVTPKEIPTIGIDRLGPGDITAATSRNEAIRHLATARLNEGVLELSVGPQTVPSSSVFASVTGRNNIAVIDALGAGRLVLAGPGAGGRETAAAVVSDLYEIARARNPRRTNGPG